MSTDTWQRGLRGLRISVTDRCNLRCRYCMPEEEYAWLPRQDILGFEEIASLVSVFAGLGVSRLRLTGGEPLLRRDLPALVTMLAAQDGIRDLAMTTNGILLPAQAAALAAAGLQRVTISLDSLRRQRYRKMAGVDMLAKALEGIECAASTGFLALKINTVVIRGENDDEIVEILEYGKRMGAEVRFIEYMDVGGATGWTPGRVFEREKILQRLAAEYGALRPLPAPGGEEPEDHAPAQRWLLPDGTVFGVIASTTSPFCSSCDRSRLTADGMWYLCLYARVGIDLRRALRRKAGPEAEELRRLIERSWTERSDRGAEARFALRDRAFLAGREELNRNPHLEMHRRGG